MPEQNTRQKKSPEEIAEAVAKAKAIMARQKKSDGLDFAKSGMISVLVAAAYFALLTYLTWLNNQAMMVMPFLFATVLYIAMGVSYMKNPFLISVVALSLFVLFFIFLAIFDLAGGFTGIIFFTFKIVVIIGLAAAIRNSIKYKKELDEINKHQQNDDLLDNELIDSF